MWDVLFTQDSKVEDLFCDAPSGLGPSLFLSNCLFCLAFKPVQDDFQHDFARTSSAGILSAAPNLPFSGDTTANSTSSLRIGCRPDCSSELSWLYKAQWKEKKNR